MTIVAYGYGLQQLPPAAGGDGLIVTLMLDPDITLDADVTLTLDDADVNIVVDDDFEIEVE